jgi:hypothetical protein
MFTGRQSVEGRAHPYRRFPSLAEAVRFAVEVQPAALVHTTIETDRVRLANNQIQTAYNSADYRAAAQAMDRAGR